MPARYLITVFIGLPIVELALLFELHGLVGFFPTVALVFLTGIAGASLVRRQGLATWFKIQTELNRGNLPAPQMIDGVMILVAGAFLVTPGVLTDAFGFALLVPMFRERLLAWLRRALERKVREGYIQVHVNEPRDFH